MDDFFSILIYIFIIVSFLSQIFKKKTPPGPPQQQHRVPQDQVPDEATIPEDSYAGSGASDYDILREVENMFKTEEQKIREAQEKKTKIQEAAEAARVKPPSERVSYEEYASRDESYFQAEKPSTVRDYSEAKVDRREHTYTDYRRRPVKVDSKIEEQARKFQDLLERRSTVEERFTTDLLRKIRDPHTMREFILVGEILARPKALRR